VKLAEAGAPAVPAAFHEGDGLALGEEVVEIVTHEGERPTAVVTRSAEGFLVLDAERTVVLDVGFEREEKPSTGWTLFSVMFGATAPSAKSDTPPRRLEEWLAADPRRGVRVYRKASGFRYLLTKLADGPPEEEADRTLEALGADAGYRRFCRERRCYRARLTPRPSACGLVALPVRYPRASAADQARFERWHASYETKRKRFATCRFLGTLGHGELDPGLAAIVELHDERTGAGSSLKLA
jgi:hypothetical protein